MKKQKLLLAVLALSAFSIGGTVVATHYYNDEYASFASDTNFWYHYSRVEPTLTKHGSKEFWANCSTHNYSLVNPGSGKDIREGVAFDTTSYFDELESTDPRYIPSTSEKIDIKSYFEECLIELDRDPYSFIPESMRPENIDHVTSSEVTYDFSSFTNVSDVKYGGFGEQWHMVVENIKESQKFLKVFNVGSEILAASKKLVLDCLDVYEQNSINITFNSDSRFTSIFVFSDYVTAYTIQFKNGITIPLFGEITPKIEMVYTASTNTKSVRVTLNENNILKSISSPNMYRFGLEYGTDTVSRKSYFEISHDENKKTTEGHVYEFVQYKENVLVPSCADFYINDTYTSVVGNKARAIVGFKGYINELYETNNGKLLGYEIREELSMIQYNTLWFNLNNISGINNVKIADSKFYVNNSETVFATKKYGGVNAKTASRRYDIENRYQYFYDDDGNEYETSIPMMFIQEEKLSEFSDDVHSVNSYLTVSVNLASKYLDKIQEDYDSLIDVFIANKDLVDSDYIVTFIG